MACHATSSVPSLLEYGRLVTDIERGRPHLSAISGAIDRICAAAWQAPAEREHAQALVARLVRLLLSSHGPAQNGEAKPVHGANLLASASPCLCAAEGP